MSFKTEPAVLVGLIQAVIVAVVACVTAFGVNLSRPDFGGTRCLRCGTRADSRLRRAVERDAF